MEDSQYACLRMTPYRCHQKRDFPPYLRRQLHRSHHLQAFHPFKCARPSCQVHICTLTTCRALFWSGPGQVAERNASGGLRAWLARQVLLVSLRHLIRRTISRCCISRPASRSSSTSVIDHPSIVCSVSFLHAAEPEASRYQAFLSEAPVAATTTPDFWCRSLEI